MPHHQRPPATALWHIARPPHLGSTRSTHRGQREPGQLRHIWTRNPLHIHSMRACQIQNLFWSRNLPHRTSTPDPNSTPHPPHTHLHWIQIHNPPYMYARSRIHPSHLHWIQNPPTHVHQIQNPPHTPHIVDLSPTRTPWTPAPHAPPRRGQGRAPVRGNAGPGAGARGGVPAGLRQGVPGQQGGGEDGTATAGPDRGRW